MKNKKWIKVGGRKKSLLGEASKSIIDHKAYQYYLQNSKIGNREDVKHYVEHGKILSELYSIIGEKIVESQGGVFINNFGYFGIIQNNKSMYQEKPGAPKKINTATDNIIYKIAFVPITKNNNLKPWVFDAGFIKSIKKSLSVALKAGKKYSFNVSLFFNLLRKNSEL